MRDHSLTVIRQCELLNIHRSGFYYCPKESFEDTVLINLIREIHDRFPYYGYRKIHWYLVNNELMTINRKKVQRLMQLGNIRAIYTKPKTSIPNDDGTVFPYLLKGLEINRPNQVWAIDITYIKLPCGMVYLFALIDWHSRFIVSYKMTNTMEACHWIEILSAALLLAIPEICNADQGGQCTGKDWIDKLIEYGIRISRDGVGRCIDNVRIERFWRSVKYEDVFLQSYDSLVEARTVIKAFIEHYNYNRPHQSLGYKTPAEIYFG